MEIEVWAVGRAKFTADPEFQEPVIREAIDGTGTMSGIVPTTELALPLLAKV